MPVGAAGFFAMVRDAGFQSSRPERAADINIEAGFELEGAELADYNRSLLQSREDECICAGKWVHDVGTK